MLMNQRSDCLRDWSRIGSLLLLMGPFALAAQGQSDPPARVIVQGGPGATAVAVGGAGSFVGTMGPNGFRGLMVGPDGKARMIKPGGPPPEGVRFFEPGEFDPFAFAFGRSFSTPRPAPTADLRPVRLAMRRGDLAGALRGLDDQARDLPHDADLEQARAMVLLLRGRFAESGKAARKAMDAGPLWDWSRARSFLDRTDDYARQYQALKRAAKDPKADPDVRMALAYQAIVAGRQEDARMALQTMLQSRPNDRHGLWLLEQLAPDLDGPEE